jgi:hypothetical protein
MDKENCSTDLKVTVTPTGSHQLRFKGRSITPIDLLAVSGGRAVEAAVAAHDACRDCHGAGGCLHPEQPCPTCGFNFAGVEGVRRQLD